MVFFRCKVLLAAAAALLLALPTGEDWSVCGFHRRLAQAGIARMQPWLISAVRAWQRQQLELIAAALAT